MTIRFYQHCPTCGRRVDVRAELFGRTVVCQHCTAEFTATANEDESSHIDPVDDLLARAEAMLDKTSIPSPAAKA